MSNNNMRRKSNTSQNGGYPKKQRYSGGGGDNRGSYGQHNRPRKNYPAAREKYLAQAREALAAGDRVLAENYFQHADHCYRMMMEEGYRRPQPQHAPQTAEEEALPVMEEDKIPENNSALPAFITATHESVTAAPASVAQDWEE